MLEQESPAKMAQHGPGGAGTDYATLFEAQVARAPLRPALTFMTLPDRGGEPFQGQSLSYQELNQRANRIAHRLLSVGIGNEAVVGVLLDRSLDMVVAMLAVQKAGAVCLPLEPSYPLDRLGSMLEDTDATCILTHTRHLDVLTRWHGRTICTDADSRVIGCMPLHNPVRTLRPSSSTQVMFTSGSTGRPKGVRLTHEGLVNFLLGMVDRPGMTENDVILSLANCSFDPSLVEIYQPLIVGARCVIVPREVATDGVALLQLVRQVRPTILNATPATFKMLIEAGWEAEAPMPTCICGGETMSPSLARDLLARSSAVWNVYGPTETTALCALHHVLCVEDPIPIGRAMPNVQLYILDDNQRPVGIGETGELCIGGVCVTRGYCKRDELTRRKFMPDPFASDDESVKGGDGSTARPARPRLLYRSGDRARWRHDGHIELLGRMDDEVKINGHRVEPAAVEAALERHPAVGQAVVCAREAGEDRLLVAWYVARDGVPISETELRAHLSRLVPPYMIPSLIIRLDSMPLSHHVKLDRQAVRQLPLPVAAVHERPHDTLEAHLVDIFQNALHGRVVGPTDDFSTMGLDSLAAVRTVRRVERELGVILPMGLLLQTRNIAQMATALRQAAGR